MELLLDPSGKYINLLDTDKFARMLDDPTQCYKFYWLDAILTLIPATENEIPFNSIFDEMIYAAWHSVTKYHLRLGPAIKGASANLLEQAVRIVESDPELVQSPSKEQILNAIRRRDKDLKGIKERLTRNVPYRLLSSFMSEIGGNDKIWDQKKRLIAYIEALSIEANLPYTIVDGSGIQKRIRINSFWKQLILDNYTVIRSWIQMKKVRFLQDRNPGVPGIIYKLGMDEERSRKLNYARKLWKRVEEISGKPLIDIYINEVLSNTGFDLDHFVPWSYIANDELWNLIPMNGRLNSKKNDKLPAWNPYFSRFANTQYYLYTMIFSNMQIRSSFEKCRRDNLNSIWASEELFVEGNTEEQFKNLLEHNLRPIYESAKIQGFKVWNPAL